jgi:hypothetical protein
VLYREEDLNDLIMKIMTFHHEFMKMFTWHNTKPSKG